ncbi:MAG TPA: hypothetical protein VEV41_03870 [Terriglobales bacterium]|nr:hypothetical protein [Terriglobales bacterium]
MARVIEVSVSSRLEFHDSLGFKHKRVGQKKPLAEGVSGDAFFHMESKWVKKERFIDREGNRYREQVTDPTTGEVIHHCDEPLSQHTGTAARSRRELFKRLVPALGPSC